AAPSLNLTRRCGDPAGRNKRRNRFLYRFKTGKARTISKPLPTLIDGYARTPHDVAPRGFGVAFLQPELPLIVWRKRQPRLALEPAVHCFGIAPQRQRLWGDGIEYFANRCRSMFYRADDPLGNVIGMNVVKHFKPEIRQNQLLAASDRGKHIRIRI